MITFVAVDFETATTSRSSACEIGLVRVEGSKVTGRSVFLIRPPSPQFLFTYLHGIAWDKVKSAPTFAELMPRIGAIFDGADFIAAHYAPFDRGVLQGTCEHYGIEAPLHPFVCTVRVARDVWNIRPTKLPDVCSALGIPLKRHHRASYDALACARIVQKALERTGEAQFSVDYLPRLDPNIVEIALS